MDRCVRCEGVLETGFMIDTGDSGIKRQVEWTSGQPKKSFWRMSAMQKESRVLPVVTYRCTACGRLESFANAVE